MSRQTRILAVGLVLALGRVAEARAQPEPLDLQGWLQLARSRAPALLAAAARVEEDAAHLSSARSHRGPRLEAGLSYLRFEDPPAVELGTFGAYAPLLENNFLAELSVTQPVFTFGRISAGIQAADWSARAAESAEAQAEVELTAAVARAYDDVLLSRALLEVARQSVDVLEESVRVAQEHYSEGTVSRLDVLRAETRLSAALSALRANSVALTSARERLAALVGIESDAAPPVAGSLEHTLIPVDTGSVLARTRSARPDVQALRALANASEAKAEAARASRLPVISVYATSLALRPEIITGRARWSWELLGGINVNWPFFDSGEAAALARAAKAAATRAEAEAAQTIDAAIAAVRGHARELERAAEDVATGRVNVDRAQRALEIAQDRYTNGIGIQLEVLQAQSDLTNARADLLRAIHAYRVALIELRRAAGVPADAQLPSTDSGGES